MSEHEHQDQDGELAALRAENTRLTEQARHDRRAPWIAAGCLLAGAVLGLWLLGKQDVLPRVAVALVRAGVPRHVPPEWMDDMVTTADEPPDEP